jgi:NET1-associated nuclear protein 1 (U3 small nucleolar RNA-associated protein 17)
LLKLSKLIQPAEGSQSFVILRVSLRTSAATATARIQKSTELVTVGKVPIAIGMGISASGKWLVVAGGTKVYVAAMSNLKASFTKFVCSEQLTCMAMHPMEDWLVTGDETGQLRLWYCLKDDLSFEKAGENRTAPTTTLHWHAHAVQALEFTPNGAYLLSGGEESVLVIWQLHTGKKEFVPRVGAPIQTISVCDTGDGTREQEYLLGLNDGSLAFIRSGTLKLSRTIARVKLGLFDLPAPLSLLTRATIQNQRTFDPVQHPLSPFILNRVIFFSHLLTHLRYKSILRHPLP